MLEKEYRNDVWGMSGNEDAGQMSAWYIFSALGFYPVAGTDLYLVGSPLFERAVLHLPGGDLVIRTSGRGGADVQVKGVLLNGEPLSDPWFKHEDIVDGGELLFETSM